ncbi:MAG: caspase family protein [Isosphaerales bacterium]
MPQTKDWAIIVGVQKYPGVSDLNGPENDAKDFRDWVVSPRGGDVPPSNVRVILTSDYPLFTTLKQARPITSDVEAAFDDLYELVWPDRMTYNPGRRLYIYMAGHGIEPQADHTALLMANAAERRFGYHILGKAYADWFFRSVSFEEILLFMDCCRDHYPSTHLNNLKWDDTYDHRAVDKVKYLYGFGAVWSKTSRERTVGVETHGVFTTALLAGLRGAASRPDNLITAASLRDYLNENMKNFLAPEDQKNPEVPKQPVFTLNPSTGEGFVIASAPAKTYQVEIGLAADTLGREVEVRNGIKFEVVGKKVADTVTWELDLPRGTYLAQILSLGRQKTFTVPSGKEDGRVDFTL